MRRSILALACLVLLPGCSLAPLLQFTSRDPGIRSSPVARELVPSADSIRIDAQMDRIEGAYILFSFEIWNLTRRTLEVEPAAFRYRILRPDGEVAVPPDPVVAEDPDRELAALDQRRSWVLSNAPKPPGEPSGFQLFIDLLDLLTAGSRTEAEERDRELLRLKQAEDERQVRAEHERRLDRLASEREAFVRERMRRTELPPGQSMTGRIAFRVAPLYDALAGFRTHGPGVAKVGAPPEQPTPGLVLLCPIGGEVRERRFSIRRY